MLMPLEGQKIKRYGHISQIMMTRGLPWWDLVKGIVVSLGQTYVALKNRDFSKEAPKCRSWSISFVFSSSVFDHALEEQTQLSSGL